MKRRVVILGGGTGGTIVANRLRRRFEQDDVEIHVVDRDDRHVYQPGLLFVPFGLAEVGEIVRPRRRQLRDGITFHEDEVESVQVERNEVLLAGGCVLGYDVLVVATGARLQPDETEGLTGDGWNERVTVPLHGGAAYVERSPRLGDALGFVPVDKRTLQAAAAPNVFALGDATDLPTSKAGSVTHFEGEVLTENVGRFLDGAEPDASYDGHAGCFIETGFRKALLIDFNYDTEPLPGHFPTVLGLPLLRESRLNHLGKLLFQWVYWHHGKIKVATVGNPGLHVPSLLGALPGFSALATRIMQRQMEKLDIPPVPEFVELIADSGARLYACRATVDMFGLTMEDFVPQVSDIISVGEFYELAAGGEIVFT